MSEDFLDDSMVNPDEKTQAGYNWDIEIQRHIIAMMLTDRQFMLQAIDIVKPSYFADKAHAKSCQILFDHFKKYEQMPTKEIMLQEMRSQLANNKALHYYIGEIQAVYKYHIPGLEHQDYLADKIIYFAKMESLKAAFNESLEKIKSSPENEKTWDEVYSLLEKAMKTESNFKMGTNYLKDYRDRYDRMLAEEQEGGSEIFVTGFPSIDDNLPGGGYRRGHSLGIMAGSGVGKSVIMACMIATNALRGKKVAYISCENDEDEIATRLDAILTGAPIRTLQDNKETIFEKLEGTQAIAQADDGSPIFLKPDDFPIVIKKFHQKTASVNIIKAYISQLKLHGFDPDMVVLDYIGEMKDYPNIPTYESRERIVDELTGLASQEGFFIVTAMQPNRGAKDAQQTSTGHISQDNFADSFGQMRPLYGCITLNQNDSESALRIGRGWVEKQRNGPKHYFFYLHFDPDNLRITEIHRETYMEKMNARREHVIEEVSTDAIKNIPKGDNGNTVNNIAKNFVPSAEKK